MEGSELVLIPERPLPCDSPLNGPVDPRLLQLFGLETLERALEDTQFQIQYTVCGHLSLSFEKQIVVCTVPAGNQTKHDGVGRCSRHDNTTLRARSPYTTALRQYQTLEEIFETFSQRERRLNDLSDEITIARTALHLQLSYIEKDRRSANEDRIKNVMLCLEQIRRTAHSMALIQQTESQGITEPAIRGFLWQIAQIIEEEVVEPATRVRIMDRIATEARFSER